MTYNPHTINSKPSELNTRDLTRTFRYKDYVWGWSMRFAWGCFAAGWAGVTAVLLIFSDLLLLRLIVAGILSGVGMAGMGLAWALADRVREFDAIMIEQYEEVKFHIEEEKPTGRHETYIDLSNGLGGQVITQPRGGAFISWLRASLENDKVNFSLRQARERGWNDAGYKVLIQQLRQIGFLHATELKNNTPVITANGRSQAQRWLDKGM